MVKIDHPFDFEIATVNVLGKSKGARLMIKVLLSENNPINQQRNKAETNQQSDLQNNKSIHITRVQTQVSSGDPAATQSIMKLRYACMLIQQPGKTSRKRQLEFNAQLFNSNRS